MILKCHIGHKKKKKLEEQKDATGGCEKGRGPAGPGAPRGELRPPGPRTPFPPLWEAHHPHGREENTARPCTRLLLPGGVPLCCGSVSRESGDPQPSGRGLPLAVPPRQAAHRGRRSRAHCHLLGGRVCGWEKEQGVSRSTTEQAAALRKACHPQGGHWVAVTGCLWPGRPRSRSR